MAPDDPTPEPPAKTVAGEELKIGPTAGDKSKYVLIKSLVGVTFVTIVAPVVVAYVIKQMENKEPANPAPGIAAPQIPRPRPMVAPFDAQKAQAGQASWAAYLKIPVEQKNAIGMTFILIPPGEFLMGSTPEQNEAGREIGKADKIPPDDWVWARMFHEVPQHRVVITKPYLMGQTEVTAGQFKEFVEATKYVTEAEQYGFGSSSSKTVDDQVTPKMKTRNWRTPGFPATDDSPVTQVSWNDAAAFCNWLSVRDRLKVFYRRDPKEGLLFTASGTGYRLPTEAEWEYAARAGTTTQFSFGDDPALLIEYGWFAGNNSSTIKPVGLKKPNPFNLFDVHGGVWEWCNDGWDLEYYKKSPSQDPFGPDDCPERIIRGGHWGYSPMLCRSTFRTSSVRTYRHYLHGFRVICFQPRIELVLAAD